MPELDDFQKLQRLKEELANYTEMNLARWEAMVDVKSMSKYMVKRQNDINEKMIKTCIEYDVKPRVKSRLYYAMAATTEAMTE